MFAKMPRTFAVGRETVARGLQISKTARRRRTTPGLLAVLPDERIVRSPVNDHKAANWRPTKNCRSSLRMSSAGPTNRLCSQCATNTPRSTSCRTQCSSLRNGMDPVPGPSCRYCSNVSCRTRSVISIDAKRSARSGPRPCPAFLPRTRTRTQTHWKLWMRSMTLSFRGLPPSRWRVLKSSESLRKLSNRCRRVNGKRFFCVIGKNWTLRKPPRPWVARREA